MQFQQIKTVPFFYRPSELAFLETYLPQVLELSSLEHHVFALIENAFAKANSLLLTTEIAEQVNSHRDI